MSIYYSKTTNGFYDDTIHSAGQIPADAVAVDPALHMSLLAAQAVGKVIEADQNGNPIAVPAPPLPIHLPFAAQGQLNESDRVVLRCIEHGVTVPSGWVNYRAALRAIVNGTDTTSTSLPVMPSYPAGT